MRLYIRVRELIKMIVTKTTNNIRRAVISKFVSSVSLQGLENGALIRGTDNVFSPLRQNHMWEPFKVICNVCQSLKFLL